MSAAVALRRFVDRHISRITVSDEPKVSKWFFVERFAERHAKLVRYALKEGIVIEGVIPRKSTYRYMLILSHSSKIDEHTYTVAHCVGTPNDKDHYDRCPKCFCQKFDLSPEYLYDFDRYCSIKVPYHVTAEAAYSNLLITYIQYLREGEPKYQLCYSTGSYNTVAYYRNP